MSEQTSPTYSSPNDGLKTLAVRIREDVRAQLGIIAQLNDRTVTEEIRFALETWITLNDNRPTRPHRIITIRRTSGFHAPSPFPIALDCPEVNALAPGVRQRDVEPSRDRGESPATALGSKALKPTHCQTRRAVRVESRLRRHDARRNPIAARPPHGSRRQ